MTQIGKKRSGRYLTVPPKNPNIPLPLLCHITFVHSLLQWVNIEKHVGEVLQFGKRRAENSDMLIFLLWSDRSAALVAFLFHIQHRINWGNVKLTLLFEFDATRVLGHAILRKTVYLCICLDSTLWELEQCVVLYYGWTNPLSPSP